jgi:hypothetical protein
VIGMPLSNTLLVLLGIVVTSAASTQWPEDANLWDMVSLFRHFRWESR